MSILRYAIRPPRPHHPPPPPAIALALGPALDITDQRNDNGTRRAWVLVRQSSDSNYTTPHPFSFNASHSISVKRNTQEPANHYCIYGSLPWVAPSLYFASGHGNNIPHLESRAPQHVFPTLLNHPSWGMLSNFLRLTNRCPWLTVSCWEI